MFFKRKLRFFKGMHGGIVAMRVNIYDMALREVKRKKFEEIVNALKFDQ